MLPTQKRLHNDLIIFLSIIAILIVIGLIFIYSASSVFASEKMGDAAYYVKRHLIGIIVGFVGLIIARFIPLGWIKKLAPLGLLGVLGMNILVLIPALSTRIHGSSRWLKLPFLTFQPSELFKIALILYVAYFLSRREKLVHTFSRSYLPILIVLGVVSALLLKQPDFGLTVTLCATVFMMLFVTHMPIKYLLITASAITPAIIALIAFQPYRLKRILTFLNPWEDPQGAGFQIIQSLIAIGSGSFWGVGISHSKQKFFYLPMQHTDFIFSIIAEETGFFGSSLLVFLYLLFLYFGIRIATQLNDTFSRLVMFGFVFLTSLQAVTNLMVTTGLVPTKGIGLPFVSYGNTGLVVSLGMIGLVINMVRENYNPTSGV